MPTEQEHLRQAARNESLYNDLCRLYTSVPKYTEWEVVALFYAALHHIEACVNIREGRHFDNHSQRNRFIRETVDYRAIWPVYSYMYRLSINARYEVTTFSIEEVRNLEINQLAAIKRHIRALLGV